VQNRGAEFQSLQFDKIKVLCVYGIDLGGVAQVADQWLKQDSSRLLVFLEDDPRAIRRFLETENAAKTICHAQIRLIPFTLPAVEGDEVDYLTTALVFEPYTIVAFSPGSVIKAEKLIDLKKTMTQLIKTKRQRQEEFLSFSQPFFYNFYKNVLLMPGARLAHSLAGKFKGVPAILCGAGASLSKQVDLLKKVSDKALIFAGGTAMNVLNSYNMLPHFGLGIDPKASQITRLLANKAFETPYFYRNRIDHEALSMMHGERLFVGGAGAYDISDYFEEACGIAGDSSLDEGFDVVSFNVSVAEMLGCNPIIIVGVDLAYTQEQTSYPTDLELHPFDAEFGQREPPNKEHVISTQDIHGNPINSRWDWVNASFWYEQFQKRHPNTILLNATEGGIGLNGIENIPLKEVAKSFTKTYDFDRLIHHALESSPMPPEVNEKHLVSLMEDLKTSFAKCQPILNELEEFYKEQINAILKDRPISLELKKGKVTELENESIYRYVLKCFEMNFRDFFEKKADLFKPYVKENVEQFDLLRSLTINKDCCGYLKKALFANAGMLNQILEKKKVEAIQNSRANFVILSYAERNPCPIKRYKNGLLEGEQFYYYGSGALKTKIIYHEGLLDGEVVLYFPDGGLKRQLHYVKGKKTGFERAWTAAGVLTMDIEYFEGVPIKTAYWYDDDGNPRQKIVYPARS